MLGGHGHDLLGRDRATSARRPRSSSIARAERFLAEHGRDRAVRCGASTVRRARSTTPDGAEAARLGPVVRGHRRDGPADGRALQRRPGRARLPRHEAAPRLAQLGTSCPDHFLRTKVRPLLLDLPPGRAVRRARRPPARAARRSTAPTTARTTTRTPTDDSPPIRGADPVIVLVPGRRHVELRRRPADGAGRRRVLRERDQRDARRRVGVDVPADRRRREVPRRVLGAGGAQAAAAPAAAAARGTGRVRHRGRVGHRPGDRRAPRRRRRVRRRRRPRRRAAPRRSRPRSASERALAVDARRQSTRRRSHARSPTAALRFGGVDLVVNNAGFAHSQRPRRHDGRRLGPAARRARARLVPREPRRGAA